jgi:hypothetical protein
MNRFREREQKLLADLDRYDAQRAALRDDLVEKEAAQFVTTEKLKFAVTKQYYTKKTPEIGWILLEGAMVYTHAGHAAHILNLLVGAGVKLSSVGDTMEEYFHHLSEHFGPEIAGLGAELAHLSAELHEPLKRFTELSGKRAELNAQLEQERLHASSEVGTLDSAIATSWTGLNRYCGQQFAAYPADLLGGGPLVTGQDDPLDGFLAQFQATQWALRRSMAGWKGHGGESAHAPREH